jgi:RND superfamily putative drug exporter
MQRETPKRNFAARVGMWSARHRKTAIIGWFTFVLVAFALGNGMGMKEIDQNKAGTGESGRASELIAQNWPQQDDKAVESVLVQSKSDSVKTTDPKFRAAVADVTKQLEATKNVHNVKSPYAPANSVTQVSKDGRSVRVDFEVPGVDSATQEKNVEASTETVAALQKSHRDLRVEQFGMASASKALNESMSKDFQKAEKLSIPLTLVILAIAFGAFVAAGIPVLLAMSAVLSTIGLASLLSQVMPMDSTVAEMILLIGLAVGVDYSLFYIKREREERAAGRGEEAALEAAASTSGRAVLISGLTVMVAMAGLYFAGDKMFASMATGGIMVVLVALIASITVLPAILSKLGDKVEKGRVPFLRRRDGNPNESRAWSWVLDRVLKRPVVSAVVAGGILVVMALPTLGLHTEQPGIETLPRSIPVMQTYDRMQESFPGKEVAAEVVIKGNDVTAPAYTKAIAQLRHDAAATGKLHEPASVEVSPNKHVANVSLPIAGDGTNEKSKAALEALRGDVMPKINAQLPAGSESGVTGMTAQNKDFNDTMKAHLPLVFLFVLGTAFVLLLFTFRSIVIPIKAIVLNLLSVGAAYGLLVEVFQNGHGEKLLGFQSTGAIASWLPLFMFVVLFGLSMDYHVFILTRVREAFDKGMKTEDAVAHGIKTTASTVTSAAIIMVGVFATFATLSMVEMKQMGIGLAAAVLIDATLVRAVLLPATMKLLGDWNWYLPKKLGWIPQIVHEPEVQPAQA